MYDTREPNLQLQAFNAIQGHAQNTREPTALELDLIKEFQQTDSRFFSSDALSAFANGGHRFMFTGTVDARLQKTLSIGRFTTDLVFDAYNLLTRSNEVEEDVVTGPNYRASTAIQPPHSVHFGLRLTF